MIEAAEQAIALVVGIDVAKLTADRQRRDALLWNFTVLGEAAAQLDEAVKAHFPEVELTRPSQLRNRVVNGYCRSTSTSSTPRRRTSCRASLSSCVPPLPSSKR